MTGAEAKALGLRALAAGFRWAPGCLTWWRLFDEDDYHGVRLHGWAEDNSWHPEGPVIEGYNQTENEHGAWEYPAAAGCWPDFRDDATLGVLVAQVREAWEPHRGSDYIASAMHTGTGWGVRARFGSEGLATIVECVHETEAHALVAALERCP